MLEIDIKKLNEMYQNDENLICGCTVISFEDYCKFKIAELNREKSEEEEDIK
ncbi:hypothetical protein [Pseudostreptobacillus hongkongensis]|uniref:hypothetical protein n=1 Tax=Pseudostreptobacillus hongkongensis TaxID=1162717 RepID=UPI000ADA5F92|nr:hypothetical protein [Pseudostreptobacillus hongkongensis]